MTVLSADLGPRPRVTSRPPAWLAIATGLLALSTLAMAVAETNLWLHYLIDGGELISLGGVAFMLIAGIYLYRQQRLLASLPLALPWLLFPVITQGDQIIDNLSINWMRAVCHVLLGALFGMPVSIVVLAATYALAPQEAGARVQGLRARLVQLPGLRQIAKGRTREGGALLAAFLLTAEIWLAVRFLGLLMVATLLLMIVAVLVYGFRPVDPARTAARHQRSERFALVMLIAGVIISLGLYVGYKNRPGAYQGSPAYFMDPAQKDAGFRVDAMAVPTAEAMAPVDPAGVRTELVTYARALEKLLAGYYILDRNYNYDFHNRLFLRSTQLLSGYRDAGLQRVREAEAIRAEAEAAWPAVRAAVPDGDPLAALLDDVRAYTAFTFGRAPVLERMSGAFEQTEAGLQHATHIYEGEGKVLGVTLAEILAKHQRALASATLAPVTSEFVAISRGVHDAYANRVVGF